MSIQDDYFDLSDSLTGSDKEAFERIWEWGVENENENERLRPIVGHMKEAITMMFEKDNDENDAS